MRRGKKRDPSICVTLTLPAYRNPNKDERLELKVLRRNAACLGSLRRFEATAEAVDEMRSYQKFACYM